MTDHRYDSWPSEGQFSFTLRDFAAIGFRHKRTLVLCFGVLAVGAVLAALLTPPKYQATAKILVKRERVDPAVTPDNNNPLQVKDEVSEEELNSEIELMQSDDVLRQTVVTCGLDKKKSLLSYLGFHRSDEEKISKAVQRLKADFHAEVIKKSNMISLSYAASDPHKAAAVLTVLTSAYVDKHLAVHRPAGQVQFFEQEADRYREDLAKAEGQLKSFADQQGGVAPQLERDLTLQKLNEFSASLESTRAEMSATEQRIRDLQKQQNLTPDRVTTSVRESDDAQVLQQLKNTLMTLELKRTELLTKYQPSYRLVQEVDKQLDDTRAAIAAEQSKPLKEETTDQNPTYSWIRTELAKAQADYSALEARSAATQSIVKVYQDKARQLEQQGLIQQDLLRTAKAYEQNYLLYLRKQEEARMEEKLDEQRILNVVVAERASVPLSPTGTSQVVFGLVGILLAATISMGIVFTKEYMDPSFRTPTEVASELKIPVLASVQQWYPASAMSTNGNGHGNGYNGNGHNGNGHNGNGLGHSVPSVEEVSPKQF
ncbi:MAG TPA: GumC family protein [Dongiaceae bacterium]|nr:GumC family protein [Dongiaceae bacterium]